MDQKIRQTRVNNVRFTVQVTRLIQRWTHHPVSDTQIVGLVIPCTRHIHPSPPKREDKAEEHRPEGHECKAKTTVKTDTTYSQYNRDEEQKKILGTIMGSLLFPPNQMKCFNIFLHIDDIFF
ncbi:hypothetical protein GDO81_027725 [Engystomops pustulosus]|uniref:Uncharacterized protein n=1 Tax=Engystomops pustulosus TaxID=76066 RepID=A0AAV6ZK20_ENGPU|nr:hypothetical protein GDO81_027725 [Engystomops pustulosus]